MDQNFYSEIVIIWSLVSHNFSEVQYLYSWNGHCNTIFACTWSVIKFYLKHFSFELYVESYNRIFCLQAHGRHWWEQGFRSQVSASAGITKIVINWKYGFNFPKSSGKFYVLTFSNCVSIVHHFWYDFSIILSYFCDVGMLRHN